ncbi:uncharacterized protein AMSG_04904 [Thecamonas trahens ATCC 50062]|uniref:MICOS complex subunit MIC10 n=1 Tax=Thecamonas trahens ATCC 50062 TaxID=461836 RepID=A0A0L0DAY4_THETB|nr:hypothetical protein AMSG_04904 [Thecamonas trahens ATCC 50062]KNC48458.1 hypothetical protein AMSG_04904 [Thecamonas trahens ATCC 50062]|eukprot:XP_013758571.1 hypothetical protein AMSG_04904 [Thecamonas trahens ATCC 50062]
MASSGRHGQSELLVSGIFDQCYAKAMTYGAGGGLAGLTSAVLFIKNSNAVRMAVVGMGVGVGLGIAVAQCSQALKTPVITEKVAHGTANE